MKQGGVPAAKATARMPKLKRDSTGLTSNIVEWRMGLPKVLDPSFGEMLNTIATGDSWQHPELTEEDIATINPPVNGVVWDAEDRKKAIVHLTMEKRKKEKRYEALQPAMWAAIMSNVSDDSTRIVEQHADWDDSITTFDIGGLITMLVDTHRGQLDTAGAPSIRTKVKAKDDFNSVQQGATETLQQYNHRFTVAKRKCDAVAVTDIPTGAELVYQWLKGLDQRRHGTMLAQLLNHPTSFPTTLTEAMATAETWTTPVRNKQGDVLCMASDLVLYSSPAQPKPHSGSSKPSGASKKQPSGQDRPNPLPVSTAGDHTGSQPVQPRPRPLTSQPSSKSTRSAASQARRPRASPERRSRYWPSAHRQTAHPHQQQLRPLERLSKSSMRTTTICTSKQRDSRPTTSSGSSPPPWYLVRKGMSETPRCFSTPPTLWKPKGGWRRVRR